MPNMSYCRFENTMHDLRDCYANMEDPDRLSESERGYRKRLIELCKEIIEEFGEEEECENCGEPLVNGRCLHWVSPTLPCNSDKEQDDAVAKS